jgi:hypothetical protein
MARAGRDDAVLLPAAFLPIAAGMRLMTAWNDYLLGDTHQRDGANVAAVAAGLPPRRPSAR